MLIEVMTLDEKVWKPSEGQVAADQVAFMCRPDREVCHPAHFEQGHCTLLQRGVPHGHKLSVLGLSIEQQQNAVCADVQGIGFAGT